MLCSYRNDGTSIQAPSLQLMTRWWVALTWLQVWPVGHKGWSRCKAFRWSNQSPEPAGFVGQGISQEWLEIIESHSIQEGQNIINLGSIIWKRFRFSPKNSTCIGGGTLRNPQSFFRSKPSTWSGSWSLSFEAAGWFPLAALLANLSSAATNQPTCSSPSATAFRAGLGLWSASGFGQVHHHCHHLHHHLCHHHHRDC